MARARKTKPSRKRTRKPARASLLTRFGFWLRKWLRRLVWAGVICVLLLVGWVALYRYVDPPGGIYMWQEQRRLGQIEHEWVDMEQIAPVMARSVVAAEDANFCRHFGFDMRAIRAALAEGGGRGASTISQQVVKNTFLWHGRNWVRKGLEAVLTPLVELIWGKERILEVYLNIAEFDEGVFGVGAASRRHFQTTAAALSPNQAARLATVLPSPQRRDASTLSPILQRRANMIADGAATIARDDRSACFRG